MTLAGTAVQVSASAEPASYSSWTVREDGVTTSEDRTFTWVEGPDDPFSTRVSAWYGQYDNTINAAANGPEQSTMQLHFTPPTGQTPTVGTSYRVGSLPATETTGRLVVTRDGRMCGRTEEQFPRPWTESDLAVGVLRFTELERDEEGNVVRLAATYELNCQLVGEAPGVAGSVVSDASAPLAAVPSAPSTPPAVTGLRALNVGPNSSGDNTTTLTWADPPQAEDTVVEANYLSAFPSLLGGAHDLVHYSRDGRFFDGEAFGNVTRQFRVTPRGPTGRLGKSTFLVVKGTRFSFGQRIERSTVGEPLRLTGRLVEDVLRDDDRERPRSLPVEGKRVEVCVQYSDRWDARTCPAIAADRTDERGGFAFTLTPERNAIYSVRIAATPRMLGNFGPLVRAEVTPHTDLRVKQDPAARSRVVVFTTSRARAGSVGRVELQRKAGKTWRTVTTRRLAGSQRGRLSISVGVPSGSQQYRVVKPADRRHTTGVSRVVRVG